MVVDLEDLTVGDPEAKYASHEANYGILHTLSQARNLENTAAGQKGSR